MSSQKGGVPEMTGGVGACKVSTCMNNDRLECSCDGIHISMHKDHAECASFVMR